jgi:Na+-driven multidrug efflux pump
VRYVAIGFGCGNLIGAVVAMLLWYRRLLTLIPERAADGGDRARMKALWQLGYPAALEQGLLQIGLIAFLSLVAKHGTAAFAAYGVGISLLSLAMVVGFGFSVAASVLVGQQIGAGNVAGARLVVKRTLRVALVVMTLPALLLAWYAQPVAFWLTNDAEITRHTVQVFYVFTLALPMIGAEFCIGGALRGAGDTRFPLLVVLVGMFGVRFSLALAFHYAGLSVGWLYATLIADFAIKNYLLWRRFCGDRWMKLLPAKSASREASLEM